jgi:hypothetical protein
LPLTQLLLIDESQTQVPQTGINSRKLSRFSVTVGVACPWSQCEPMLRALAQLRQSVFVPQKNPTEWKGRYLVPPGNRRAGVTIDEASNKLAALVIAHGLSVWVMVADRTAFSVPGMSPALAARGAARQFLLERVIGNPAARNAAPGSWAIVADHETSRELGRLTSFMAHFSNPFNKATLPTWIHGAALAGASEDWAGIQVADVYAYFAAHFRAQEMKLGGDPDVAAAFKARFWPTLMCDAGGRTKGIGYKTW